tara:strand:+ start:1003 stop:1197 length:195 start_codon:yes stop_codon:yes gene_type:complete
MSVGIKYKRKKKRVLKKPLSKKEKELIEKKAKRDVATENMNVAEEIRKMAEESVYNYETYRGRH